MDAHVFPDVWERFGRWCESLRNNNTAIPIVWVGHNIQAFDLNFMTYVLRRYSLEFPLNSGFFFDTLRIVTKYATTTPIKALLNGHKEDGSKGKKTLECLYHAITGTDIANYHDAAADVAATVVIALCDKIWPKRLLAGGTLPITTVTDAIHAKLDKIKIATEHPLPLLWKIPTSAYQNLAVTSHIPKSGPSLAAQKVKTIAELVSLCFTLPFLQKVVIYTNKHIDSKKKTEHVDINEIRAAIALLIALGALGFKKSARGWMKLFGNNLFSDAMTFKHFQYIWNHISFYDCENIPQHDMFGKVRYLISHVNTISQELWTVGAEFALDEYLIPYNGRFCGAKQRLPKAGCRDGIKVFACCDSNGYLFKLLPYQGAGHNAGGKNVEQSNDGFKVSLVVNELIPKEFFSTGRTLYCDNWYTSYPLFKKLWELNIFAIGVLACKNKRLKTLTNDGYPFIPPKSKAILKTLPEGWIRIAERSLGKHPVKKVEGTMSAIVWLDKKQFHFYAPHARENLPMMQAVRGFMYNGVVK